MEKNNISSTNTTKRMNVHGHKCFSSRVENLFMSCLLDDVRFPPYRITTTVIIMVWTLLMKKYIADCLNLNNFMTSKSTFNLIYSTIVANISFCINNSFFNERYSSATLADSVLVNSSDTATINIWTK